MLFEENLDHPELSVWMLEIKGKGKNSNMVLNVNNLTKLLVLCQSYLIQFKHEIYLQIFLGIAFLWHMVRCIMALLFMVGKNEEPPESVSALLDIDNMPSKPHYKMAPDLPLVLHECGFDNMKIQLQPQVFSKLFYVGRYDTLLIVPISSYLIIYHQSFLIFYIYLLSYTVLPYLPLRCYGP